MPIRLGLLHSYRLHSKGCRRHSYQLHSKVCRRHSYRLHSKGCRRHVSTPICQSLHRSGVPSEALTGVGVLSGALTGVGPCKVGWGGGGGGQGPVQWGWFSSRIVTTQLVCYLQSCRRTVLLVYTFEMCGINVHNLQPNSTPTLDKLQMKASFTFYLLECTKLRC